MATHRSHHAGKRQVAVAVTVTVGTGAGGDEVPHAVSSAHDASRRHAIAGGRSLGLALSTDPSIEARGGRFRQKIAPLSDIMHHALLATTRRANGSGQYGTRETFPGRISSH